MSTLITVEIFRAFLDCKTKAFLKLSAETEPEFEIIEWKKNQFDDYRRICLTKIRENNDGIGYSAGTLFPSNSEISKCDFMIDCIWQTYNLQSRIDALEYLASNNKRKKHLFLPIRFVPNEKITNNDRLQLAFDALVISCVYNQTPSLGKIIYGSKYKTTKIDLVNLIEKTKTTVKKIVAQQENPALPQLVLNKHCSECEFKLRCRPIAIEKDELTLLSRMSEKERNKQHSKGIFSVTQLSYTFRTRRSSKHPTTKKEKYSHALKALAIREKKIYLIGKPELSIEGTPVFLDVEGIPDQDTYYLIGLRLKERESHVQLSLWADKKSDEKKIWLSFLQNLAKVDNPKLIHYGSYETVFLKRMKDRYPETTENFPFLGQVVAESINLLSLIYARVYFPTYTNGLKEIARYLGFQWSDTTVSGLNAVMWRSNWELSKNPSLKQKLLVYNAEDCTALEKITNTIAELCKVRTGNNSGDVIRADELKPESIFHFGNTTFSIPELEYINHAAYWDYQRNKVYIKSSKRLKRIHLENVHAHTKSLPINKVVELNEHPAFCPKCDGTKFYKNGRKSRIIYDIKFSQTAIKRWVVKYFYYCYKCTNCKTSFILEEKPWTRSKYGLELQAYVVYQILELRLSGRAVVRNLNQLFDLNLNKSVIQMFKANLTQYYKDTFESILQNILTGCLLHVDETRINIKKKDAYVWVLTNLEEVIYFYTETREGDTIKSLLQPFKGVLVTDFYATYDTINCPQQKCLIHFIRDLNDDLFKQPFNEELKDLAQDFSTLLKPIVETIDRFGLKARFLQKHKVLVERFYKKLFGHNYESEIVDKYKKRFKKNREKLFTFLNYDGIPWNNNNAETAIKAFAGLRKSIEGPMSEKGIHEYLTLLSIRETCKYKGISFLDFLRSREKDIDAFIRRH
jgi:predicted RecB family nuclease